MEQILALVSNEYKGSMEHCIRMELSREQQESAWRGLFLTDELYKLMGGKQECAPWADEDPPERYQVVVMVKEGVILKGVTYDSQGRGYVTFFLYKVKAQLLLAAAPTLISEALQSGFAQGKHAARNTLVSMLDAALGREG